MTRSTAVLLSVLSAVLLHAAPGHAQSQLQTDNARRLGGNAGPSQLQTDTGRRVAEEKFLAARRAQAQQDAAGANGGQMMGGDQPSSPAAALKAAAAADALNLSSRYANSTIVGRGNNSSSLEVGSDGLVRPTAPDDGGDR
jgi:hypothetical protein